MKQARRKVREARKIYEGFFVLHRQIRQIEGTDGISLERLSVLETIYRRQPISIGALAEESGVRPATMSRMVSSMDDVGWVQRLVDENDGRGVLIALSLKGQRIFERAHEESGELLEASLHKLSEIEIETLVKLGRALTSFYLR